MRFFRLWLPLGCLSILFIACQQVEISTSTKSSNFGSHKHIQVIASGSGVSPDGMWPPQPANMTKTGVLDGNYGLQALSIQKASIQDVIMADSALINALGANYLILDVNISEQKNNSLIQEVMFFSYSNNATIRAWLMPDHSIEFEVIAASDYQFPETKEEVSKSIALARASLVSQGFSNAQTLNAHAMLTYPDETSTKRFYDVRMLYVTLGQGHGAVPVYAAWVDLSNSTVTKSGLIESY